MISTLKKKERCSIRIMGNRLQIGERVSTGFSGKVEALKQAKEKGKIEHSKQRTKSFHTEFLAIL